MALHNELGKIGEKMAMLYLVDKGYAILEVNYFYDKAEIDIIAFYKEQLIIVEVKTRNSNFFGDPQSFVTRKKIRQLVKVADYYLVKHQMNVEARFDIIAILINKNEESIEHYEDAFYPF